MNIFTLPYGKEALTLRLPEHFQVDRIEPAYVPAAADPLAVVRAAVEHPVDGIPLAHYIQGASFPGFSVAIAVNDKTRPVPHEHMLPPLLDHLASLGVPDSAIRFFIATGTHLPMPPDEFERILPREIIERYCVVSHNIDGAEYVSLGVTSRGTPVQVNRLFYESSLKIVTGNIEPHHFAGFSGGYKTAAIGLGARATINQNHAMLVDPDARIAEFDRNPLRQDIEEMGDRIGVQLALNVILNGEKKVVQAVAGAPRAVMNTGIPISRAICQTRAPGERYDLVIASVGGAPKDINFYQSQKAITHASLLTRDGGVILLAAACPEGSGSQSYEQFMEGVSSPAEVFEKFRRMGFKVGPHKAFQVARDAARVHIVLLSQIPAGLVTKLLMTPAATLDEAVEKSLALLGASRQDRLRVAVLPRATNTIAV